MRQRLVFDLQSGDDESHALTTHHGRLINYNSHKKAENRFSETSNATDRDHSANATKQVNTFNQRVYLRVRFVLIHCSQARNVNMVYVSH